ncbi:MAG TPA: hypothetical protein VFM06_10755 [Candidatus Limnocylindria bacterium]|nr:hypothetical protein [Candidatus Limnocylindria bacterium]
MFSERIQVLMTKAQRRRLETEARQRGTSVGALIREAIDTREGRAPLADRLRAVGEIKAITARAGGKSLSVEDIERLVDEEREEWLARLEPPRLRRRR